VKLTARATIVIVVRDRAHFTHTSHDHEQRNLYRAAGTFASGL